MSSESPHEMRTILGRVRPNEFIGRTAELRALAERASQASDARGMLIMSAPMAGVSELLRQAYDRLFHAQSSTVPIYFRPPHSEATPISVAIEFLNTFLLQYVAFQRNQPSLSSQSLTLDEVVQLAPAADLDWIEELVDDYDRQRFGEDDRELVRLCLTVPRRIPGASGRAFVMFDATHLPIFIRSGVGLEAEIVRALTSNGQSFALAGLRRSLVGTVESAGASADTFDKLHLTPLADDDARELVATTARRLNVSLNEETRDLLVKQLEGSPFFITAIIQAAHDKHLALDSYFACERLYADELLGGSISRRFTYLLERVIQDAEMRRHVVNLLCEAVPVRRRTATFEGWAGKIQAEPEEVEALVARLHEEELINRDGETINVESGPSPWGDFLRSRFRLDSLREPRALVVADLMAGALKRAPQTIERHYRQAANLHLREMLDKFNFQLVPRKLFRYDQFAHELKGSAAEENSKTLDADIDLLRLPQIFHTASGVSFSSEFRQFAAEVSVVAHGFDGPTYTDSNEVVWLVARVQSKLAVDEAQAKDWLDRLTSLARSSGFVRTQIWLVSNEGFSATASEILDDRGAFSSSQKQLELLVDRLGFSELTTPASSYEEIELVLPMGSDYELLAASTVEQIARRINFRPEAINQIKTAIVEACINASEHSLSPDRKIYQRFLVENDKLVITISSRGIVPSSLVLSGENSDNEFGDSSEQRRGWGLKLIKTLMDEVEFERVDEGTRLRMSKYVRNQQS